LEVAQERTGPCDLFPGDRLLGRPRLLVVGPLVAELADYLACCVRSDVAKRVVDDGQPLGGATRRNILDLVVPAVDPPLEEVADDAAVVRVVVAAGRPSWYSPAT
jgi:hypothetical protein